MAIPKDLARIKITGQHNNTDFQISGARWKVGTMIQAVLKASDHGAVWILSRSSDSPTSSPSPGLRQHVEMRDCASSSTAVASCRRNGRPGETWGTKRHCYPLKNRLGDGLKKPSAEIHCWTQREKLAGHPNGAPPQSFAALSEQTF